MRKLLLITLLGLTAVAQAKTTFLLNVPLQWKPPSQLNVAAVIPPTTIQVEPFQDVRQDKETIGRNSENSPPKPVTTTDDVGAFVATHVQELLQTAGANIVENGGVIRISGKVTRFFIEETSRYNAQVAVQMTVSSRGRVLWSGLVSGDASHFGRSYKLDNYYEGFSDAITNLVGSMLQNTFLMKSLRVPAGSRHSELDEPAAEPIAPAGAPPPRTVVAHNQHSASSKPQTRVASAKPAPEADASEEGSPAPAPAPVQSAPRGSTRVAAAKRAPQPAASEDAPAPLHSSPPPTSTRVASAQPVPAEEASPASTPVSRTARWVPQKRLALVIGNSDYGNQPAWPDLQGEPLKDAEQVAASLRQLHFEVTLVRDANYGELHSRLDQFGKRLTPDTLALFYFAGHGAQAPLGITKGGTDNYLIPVGTNLQREGDVHFNALALTEVSEVLHRARAGIVILDACRTNGLQRSGGGRAIRGLQGTDNVPGMLVVYSAPPGEVADNHSGQISRYTQALIDHLATPDQSLGALFRAVRQSVPGNRPLELADTLNEDIWLEAAAPPR